MRLKEGMREKHVELDFKEVTRKKASLIESYSQLKDKIGATTSISRDIVHIFSYLPRDLNFVEQQIALVGKNLVDVQLLKKFPVLQSRFGCCCCSFFLLLKPCSALCCN